MSVHVELWELIVFLAGLLLAFFGCIWAFARLLDSKQEKRLDERFSAMERARIEGQARWDAAFASLQEGFSKDSGHWQRLERDILGLRAELPLQYVLRQDYVRNQTVIEAKLDALASRFELGFMKGRT